MKEVCKCIPVNAIQYSDFLIRLATCSASFFSFSYESWISAVFNASLIISSSALVIPEALSFDNLLINVYQQTSWNVANPLSSQFTWKSDRYIKPSTQLHYRSPIKLYFISDTRVIKFSLSSLSLSVNYEITIIYLPERSFFGKAYALVSTLPSVDLMGPLSHEIAAHFHNLESPDPVAILMRFVDFERMDWFKYPGYRHKYVCNCCWYAPVT